MIVNLGSVVVSKIERRAIRAYYGREGLASRHEVQRFFQTCGSTTLVDVVHEFEKAREERAARAFLKDIQAVTVSQNPTDN